jgi:cytochrome c-type biogenesis protein CcmH/NrfG
MEAGDFIGAIAVLESSAEAAMHFKTFELLGECYLRLERYPKAVMALAAATIMNKGVRAPSLLAEALMHCGQEHTDAVKTVVKMALERDPNNRKTLEMARKVKGDDTL